MSVLTELKEHINDFENAYKLDGSTDESHNKKLEAIATAFKIINESLVDGIEIELKMRIPSSEIAELMDKIHSIYKCEEQAINARNDNAGWDKFMKEYAPVFAQAQADVEQAPKVEDVKKQSLFNSLIGSGKTALEEMFGKKDNIKSENIEQMLEKMRAKPGNKVQDTFDLGIDPSRLK